MRVAKDNPDEALSVLKQLQGQKLDQRLTDSHLFSFANALVDAYVALNTPEARPKHAKF